MVRLLSEQPLLNSKTMKRHGNLFEKVISAENLELADRKARKGKHKQKGVLLHDQKKEENLQQLHQVLKSGQYRTSQYSHFTVYEPKERLVSRLPYYPDRIVHHAVMNILEPIFMSVFTTDTYSSMKGRGIHSAAASLKKALYDEEDTRYCLKLDIQKFYPSIDHLILKRLLRRKFKDQQLLELLDEIIDSAPGVPIGNYLSQYLANYYLSGFDHWIKQEKRVRYYYRYCDDLVILGSSKEQLHQLLSEIRAYLEERLKLQVKGNYQVFPVAIRGIDFVGYRFFPGYTLLRKTIKKNFARMMARHPKMTSVASYYGWACHCDSKKLLTKLLSNEKLQRIRDRSRSEELYRRQNKDRQDTEQGNSST